MDINKRMHCECLFSVRLKDFRVSRGEYLGRVENNPRRYRMSSRREECRVDVEDVDVMVRKEKRKL